MWPDSFFIFQLFNDIKAYFDNTYISKMIFISFYLLLFIPISLITKKYFRENPYIIISISILLSHIIVWYPQIIKDYMLMLIIPLFIGISMVDNNNKFLTYIRNKFFLLKTKIIKKPSIR